MRCSYQAGRVAPHLGHGLATLLRYLLQELQQRLRAWQDLPEQEASRPCMAPAAELQACPCTRQAAVAQLSVRQCIVNPWLHAGTQASGCALFSPPCLPELQETSVAVHRCTPEGREAVPSVL